MDNHASTMTRMVNEFAKNNHWNPRRVWLELKQKLDKKSSIWIGMSNMQVMNEFKHIRYQAIGKDVLHLIEQPHAGKMKDYKFWFL